MHLGSIEIGSIRVDAIDGGSVWLDGGSLFGIVPKVLWNKEVSCDEKNRVRLSFFSLLVRSEEATIVIEAGSGAHQPPKMQEAMSVDEPCLLDTMSSLGVAPEDVNFFIPSHLHFDHVGGASTPDGKGLTFPNARYVFQKKEWEEANRPMPININAYIPGDIAPLWSAKRYLVEGATEVTPGVEVIFTSGHSVGHQIVRVGAKGRDALFFAGDIIPTSENANPRWACAFDVYPVETYNAKVDLLSKAAEKGYFIAPGHGGNAPICTVAPMSGGRYIAQRVSAISPRPRET